MNIKDYGITISEELKQTLSGISEPQTEAFLDALLHSKRIFTAGAGRSLLMIRGLAMRLMQTGFTSYVVGETVTPAITSDDLLLIASGSGETGSLKIMAAKAKEIKAKIGLITIYPDSSIGKLADFVVQIPAPTSKSESKYHSIQPGASLFEQSVLLLGDSMILKINEIHTTQNPNEGLMKLHANLE